MALPGNEMDWIERLTSGDKEAFTLIYRTYIQELFRFARRSIARKEDAEEIIQEVFESLWLRHPELSHITSLRQYLYSAVRYKIIRYFSRLEVKKKYEEHYRFFETLYDTLPADDREPDALLHNILRAMEPLPARCREAMELRLTENLSNSEIANRMGISKETVENYMVKAISHLRTIDQSILKPSVMSIGNCRIESFQFYPGRIRSELPIYS